MNRATLIAGIGGGLLTALLLAPATGTALGELARARSERADAAAVAATPTRLPPLVDAGARVRAVSEAEAGRAAAERLRRLAAGNGVLVEQVETVRGGGGLVRLRVRLSGSDRAVIALIDRIERDRPLLRFRSWRVTALSDSGLRLDGEAVGAWR